MPNTTGAVLLPYPELDGSGPDNVPADFKALADAVAGQVPRYIVGTRAANPPGIARRFLLESDVVWVDNGTTWVRVSDIVGPDAQTLDGYDSTAFRKVTDPVDAATLGGIAASGFLPFSGKAADADKLDGVDSITFARKDQANTFTGSLSAPGVYDTGNRVYSASNPPPVSGAVIVKTLRGVLTVPNTGAEATFTIASVDPAKSQLRLLGASYQGSTSGSVARIRLIGATTIGAIAHRLDAGNSNDSFVSYELTEWS